MTRLTYPESLTFLYGLQQLGIKLGLQNIRRLAELLGNPQQNLKFIHIAGTNGKGSTCAMLESIYRHAGYKVGLYTSPHLVSFRERIQVNRTPIPKDDVSRLTGLIAKVIQTHFTQDNSPTFFEATTAMALLYFAEQGCDLVIWETGLGGRLDASNIVNPLASVITTIHYDHQKWLGNTLAEIAREKAGIIKPGVPAITCKQLQEAETVIRKVASNVGAPFFQAEDSLLNEPPIKDAKLALKGPHQKTNAALALLTVKVLMEKIPVPIQACVQGLESVYWPARFQILKLSQNQIVVVDGAHNQSGAERLMETLNLEFPGQKPTFIIGVARDKDWEQILRLIGRHAQTVYCVPLRTSRTADPLQLSKLLQEEYPQLHVAVAGCFREAFAQCANSPLVVVTGSLYLAGEALEFFGAPGLPEPDPLDLNTWANR